MKKNNYLLRGGFVGGIIGLIFSIIVNLVLSRDFNHFLEVLPARFFISLILILIFALLGTFVSFLGFSVKSKIIWKVAILGGVIGVVFSVFVMAFWEVFWWIIKPISNINYLITGCVDWCIYMIFVYPIIFAILSTLIFSIVAFTILKMKEGNKNGKKY